MKKLATISVLAVALLLIAVLAAVLLWKRVTAITAHPAELVPADTLFLAEVVDLHQTIVRWPGTELNKLFEEPEVKSFLEKPMSHWDSKSGGDKYAADLIKTMPRQIFVAVTSLDAGKPKFLGGFSFAGDRAAAQRLLEEPRQQLKAGHPTGHAELATYRDIELQTYTDRDFVLAEVFHKGWYLAASDVALLKSTIDRLEAANPKKDPAAGTLAADEAFRHTVSAVPADSEIRLYGKLSALTDRLATAMIGMEGMNGALKDLQEVQGVAASSKIEGGQWRDTIFTYRPGKAGPPAAVLPRQALALTTADTAVFYSTDLGGDELGSVPPELLRSVPFVPAFEAALKEQNATLKDLGSIFGHEVSLIVQNGKGGNFGTAIALPLQDHDRAAQLAKALTSPNRGAEAWSADDSDGLPVYSPPGSAAPVIAITDRFCLVGASASSIASFLKPPGGAAQLDSTPAFKTAAATVSPPTTAFGYIDLGTLFESGYVLARPLLAVTLATNESTSEYIDAGKLPSGGVIGRHLGTTVISQSTRPDGNLWESRGNLSTAQLVFGGGGALIATVMNSPLLQQMAPTLPSMLGLPGANPSQPAATSLGLGLPPDPAPPTPEEPASQPPSPAPAPPAAPPFGQ